MNPICVACDAGVEMQAFAGETHMVEHHGRTHALEYLSGLRCPHCGEIEFTPESAARYAAAGDELVLAERLSTGRELRRIRKKLRLGQHEAALLTGGGHNAFSRYETGKITPSPAVLNLFRLLDRHPEELETLRRA